MSSVLNVVDCSLWQQVSWTNWVPEGGKDFAEAAQTTQVLGIVGPKIVLCVAHTNLDLLCYLDFLADIH